MRSTLRCMTEPDPSRVPFLLDRMRHFAEQLLEQTAEVETWVTDRHPYAQLRESRVWMYTCEYTDRAEAA